MKKRKNKFHSYDKGRYPQTGKAILGALMGSYRFIKSQYLLPSCQYDLLKHRFHLFT
ncbi:MAG TPA: CpcT/CpeT family chromophore lyase [Candidatus Sericytochromatia bacterium]